MWSYEKWYIREFPVDPVVKTALSLLGLTFNPCWGTKIPQAVQQGQKKKKDISEVGNRLNKRNLVKGTKV